MKRASVKQGSRKPSLPTGGHLDDMLREGGAEHTMADARAAIVAAQRHALEVCAAALLALDDPFAPASCNAVDRFDRLFDPNGARPEFHAPTAVLFGLRDARARLSWGPGQEPRECPGIDHRCGYPVQRGERLCWMCQVGHRAGADAA